MKIVLATIHAIPRAGAEPEKRETGIATYYAATARPATLTGGHVDGVPGVNWEPLTQRNGMSYNRWNISSASE